VLPGNILVLSLACLTGSLLLGAWLWWSGHRSASRLQKAFELAMKQVEEERAAWREEFAACGRRMEHLEEELKSLRQAQAPRPGMNLTKRAVALRMHRRGERAEQIAAALGVARAEVELLLKVHRLAAGETAVGAGPALLN
jgi:chromosome segregation ATPase